MTNRELLTAAFRMLTVLDSDETLNAEDGALGLGELNNLMTDLASEGIDLGFPPQDNLSDDFPLDEQTAGQVKPILAMYLFTFYPSAKFPPTLPARAERAHERLLLDSVLGSIEEADMSNLPRGSGSRCRGDIFNG
jgi:hypothetical protein